MKQMNLEFDDEPAKKTIVLRDYQEKAVNDIRQCMMHGKKRIILNSATGSGKTATSVDIISKTAQNGFKVLFLANRRELVFQAKATLENFGLDCGMIMSGEESDLDKPVQIASMQTFIRRMDLEDLAENRWFHDAKLCVVDECHSSVSPSYLKILNAYGDDVYTIGLTATPGRGDQKPLGEYYEEIVSTISVAELTEQGYLVPARYFVPSTPDLENLKMTAGDYNKKELGERVNQAKLVGDIYENWSVICPDRPTIIFATNVAHSISIRDAYRKHGVEIEHIDARTPKEERGDAIERLRSGKLRVITNVGILTEGFDFPEAGCIVLARPTKSLGLYIQMGGRGLRIAPLKQNCIILDHGGCVSEHGYLDDEIEWTLEGKEKAWSKPKRKEKEKKTVKCTACNLVFEGSDRCPDCGSIVKSFGKAIETLDAELIEAKGKKKLSRADKRIFWGMTQHYRAMKCYKQGWAAWHYKGFTGVWPRGMDDVAPIKPDEKFLNWLRHVNIKKAKSRVNDGS